MERPAELRLNPAQEEDLSQVRLTGQRVLSVPQLLSWESSLWGKGDHEDKGSHSHSDYRARDHVTTMMAGAPLTSLPVLASFSPPGGMNKSGPTPEARSGDR